MRRFASALLSVALAAAGTALAQDRLNIRIGTGGNGGVYYPMGAGLAKILSKYVPGMQATAEVTGGSNGNLKLIGTGKADVGFSMADAGWNAVNGLEVFKDGKIPVRTLAVLYPNRMHTVTVEGTGIDRIADLRGKRVSTGDANGATRTMAWRVLEAAGIDRNKDLRRENLGVAASVSALKDRKIDAFFWVGGVPTAAVTDLATASGTKIRILDHAEFIETMNRKYGPLYVQDTIPAKAYPGLDRPVQVASVWNILVAHRNLPDAVAYSIVKTLFDRKADMIAVHREAQNIEYEFQTNYASPIPFHPGAIRYFAEKGIQIR